MPAQKIDGVLIAKHIRQHVAIQVKAITSSGKRAPGLAVVLVGSDAASHVTLIRSVKLVKKLDLYPNHTTYRRQRHNNRCSILLTN